jgi:hypothetical protein
MRHFIQAGNLLCEERLSLCGFPASSWQLFCCHREFSVTVHSQACHFVGLCAQDSMVASSVRLDLRMNAVEFCVMQKD